MYLVLIVERINGKIVWDIPNCLSQFGGETGKEEELRDTVGNALFVQYHISVVFPDTLWILCMTRLGLERVEGSACERCR